MRSRTLLMLGLGVIVTLLCATAAEAGKNQGWEKLGERQVTDRVDHDEIAVTAAKGDFRSLKLLVRERGVQFHDMTIHFGNGSKQDVALRVVIPAGGESRVIDVAGNDRTIRRVTFAYDAQSLGGRQATVVLFGRN